MEIEDQLEMIKFDKEKLEIRIGFKYDHHALYVLDNLN
jgi:hypothetical protein